MPDESISQMPPADPITGAELLPVVQGGVNKRVSAGALLPPKPLNWLSDVAAPADTPAGNVLGTTGEGVWEPLNFAYMGEQLVGPLQAQIGDPRAVAVHTDLVGYIHEVADRVSALEATEVEIAADLHFFVDKYSTSFTRVMVVPPTATWPVKVDFALATTPGPGGAVFPDLGSVSGGSAVWADFAGTLGKLTMANGDTIYGSTLKEWIRRGSVATVRRDDSDPAHPNLLVDKLEQPTAAGSSISLDSLADVTAPSTTPAGKVLGTTAEGAWGAVEAEDSLMTAVFGARPAPFIPNHAYTVGNVVRDGNYVYRCLLSYPGGTTLPHSDAANWVRVAPLTSIVLNTLGDVTLTPNTAPGKLLGTTAPGVWTAVDGVDLSACPPLPDALADGDLLLVQRGANRYRITLAELKAALAPPAP